MLSFCSGKVLLTGSRKGSAIVVLPLFCFQEGSAIMRVQLTKPNKLRWEHRVLAYHQRLNDFFDELPAAMRILIEDVPTYNADIVRYGKEDTDFSIVIHIVGELHLLLVYTLTGLPAISRPRKLNQRKLKWIYDELDKSQVYRHRILLSNESILTIPFSNFKLKRLNYEVDSSYER